LAGARRKKNRAAVTCEPGKKDFDMTSHRILGPAAVLDIEVFDRAWQPAISSNGVVVEVGRLRARALVERVP